MLHLTGKPEHDILSSEEILFYTYQIGKKFLKTGNVQYCRETRSPINCLWKCKLVQLPQKILSHRLFHMPGILLLDKTWRNFYMSVCKIIHKPIITNSENKQNLEATQMSINSIKDQCIVAQLLIHHFLVIRWGGGSLGIHGGPFIYKPRLQSLLQKHGCYQWIYLNTHQLDFETFFNYMTSTQPGYYFMI